MTDEVDRLADALDLLFDRASVARVHYEHVTRPAAFRGGDVNEETQAITRAARAEQDRAGFGFWPFALARVASAPSRTQTALISGALRHSEPDPSSRVDATPAEFVRVLRSGAWTGLPDRELVSLCSSVKVKGEPAVLHLPMLDFGLPSRDPAAIPLARQVVSSLGVSGLLLDSGRSFHFIGDSPLARDELGRLLARASLLDPLIDSRWVAHALIDGECRLRVSTNVTGRTALPRPVAPLTG